MHSSPPPRSVRHPSEVSRILAWNQAQKDRDTLHEAIRHLRGYQGIAIGNLFTGKPVLRALFAYKVDDVDTFSALIFPLNLMTPLHLSILCTPEISHVLR